MRRSLVIAMAVVMSISSTGCVLNMGVCRRHDREHIVVIDGQLYAYDEDLNELIKIDAKPSDETYEVPPDDD